MVRILRVLYMPISNGNLGFNVGRDVTLVLIGPNGRIQLDNVMGWEVKQEVAQISMDRLDGVQGNAALPKGWSGSFEIERANSGVDDAFAQIESAWYANGSYSVSTIYEYIANADGSRSTYQYDSCSLVLDNAGSWKGDATVRQKISFKANRRKAV